MASTIDRRLLLNYQADPERVSRLLPSGLHPQVIRGKAVVGICLIRLSELRPKALPRAAGITCENAAHRFAVEWTDQSGRRRSGVYIPGRHTSSRLVAVTGSRIYGPEAHARFRVAEDDDCLSITLASGDGQSDVRVVAGVARAAVPRTSVFETADELSRFFQQAPIGRSPHRGGLANVRLESARWEMHPVEVRQLRSAFYDDPERFPAGTIAFDSAAVMWQIPATWLATPEVAGAA